MPNPEWTRLHQLTAEDFRKYPIWHFEHRQVSLGSQDFDLILNGNLEQEWTIPAPGHEPLTDDGTAFLVHTRFTISDGTIHDGFCSPCDDSGLDYIQSVLIAPGGHMRFWFDWKLPWREPEAFYKKLGKEPGQVFPVWCQSLVECEGRNFEVILNEILIPEK